MTLFGNKKIQLFIFVVLIFLTSNINALENKILIKVNNEIITSLDVNNEINYLIALNKNIQNLENKKIYTIAKNSLIREKIKKIEILNYIDEIKIDKKFFNQILKLYYSKMGINNKDEFLKYIENYNIDMNTVEQKMSIEALWNELIVSKFSDKVKINKYKLKERASIKDNKQIKIYLLSEILFNISNNAELKIKSKEIKNSILNVGFENTALIFSISDSSKIGGKLDWIKENSLNNKVRNELNNMNIGDLTNPIITPGGFLILKIEDIELKKGKFNLEIELENLIKIETNTQLNQYSNIYFNKISKNFKIDEF